MVPTNFGWMKEYEVGEVESTDLLHSVIMYVFGL